MRLFSRKSRPVSFRILVIMLQTLTILSTVKSTFRRHGTAMAFTTTTTTTTTTTRQSAYCHGSSQLITRQTSFSKNTFYHYTHNSHHFSTIKKSTFSRRMTSSSTTPDTTEPTSSSPEIDNANNSNAHLNEPRRIRTKDARQPTPPNEVVKIQGWVRTIRKQKTLAFIEVNDGSNMAGLQGVISLNDSSLDVQTELNKVTTGCAIEMVGPLVQSLGNEQSVDLLAQSLTVIGPCPAETFPLAKKRHTLERLRSWAHLRARTNTIAAVARVRSRLAGAIHDYFQQQGFVYVQTPIITASDCEGAGELFRVTTFNLDEPSKLPLMNNTNNNSTDVVSKVDYTHDFFGKPAYLTVSGQLSAETYACALGDVYTFGPTFRAENSQTTRHLAEFHMVEPEMAFADLSMAMDNAEGLLKHVVKHVLEHCSEDLDFFQRFYDKTLLDRLQKLVSQPFVRIPYREAVDYLQKEISKDPSKWKFPQVDFGTDLATEHERWLAETKFQSAVFVYNYPKAIKAFYMRDNDSDNCETVNAMDLLVPGVGELVGGSQREERLEVLEKKILEAGLNLQDYWWYLDLRRFGSVPHSGYGLGFERLVTYVCGMENIRDAIAFPRFPGNAEF